MEGYVTFSVLEKFLKQFSAVKAAYKRAKDATALEASIKTIAEEYHDYFGIGDLILVYGEELISSGDQDAGIAVLKILKEQFACVANQTLLFMRLAENAFINENVEECKAYLFLLCERVDNYEEMIKTNDLQDVWERCKYLVENDICKSDSLTARSSNECSMNIKEIVKLPQDELVVAMLEHLDKLSASGKRLELLSKQEFYVFIINEFVEAINSDGLEHYFSYNSGHFTELYQAFCAIGCDSAKELWRKLGDKILTTVNGNEELELEKALLQIENLEIDLEREEGFYYKKVEKKLLKNLCSYILENADCFK